MSETTEIIAELDRRLDEFRPSAPANTKPAPYVRFSGYQVLLFELKHGIRHGPSFILFHAKRVSCGLWDWLTTPYRRTRERRSAEKWTPIRRAIWEDIVVELGISQPSDYTPPSAALVTRLVRSGNPAIKKRAEDFWDSEAAPIWTEISTKGWAILSLPPSAPLRRQLSRRAAWYAGDTACSIPASSEQPK